MSAPIKFYRAWTPQKAGLHYIGRNAPDARARKNFFKRWARAHSEKYLLTFAKRAGGPPAPWGGGLCARARALSTRDFQNSHFLLYNFQNNQGKSCSAPRVWQLCKSSAQSEPISKSYDQNNIFFPDEPWNKHTQPFKATFKNAHPEPLGDPFWTLNFT